MYQPGHQRDHPASPSQQGHPQQRGSFAVQRAGQPQQSEGSKRPSDDFGHVPRKAQKVVEMIEDGPQIANQTQRDLYAEAQKDGRKLPQEDREIFQQEIDGLRRDNQRLFHMVEGMKHIDRLRQANEPSIQSTARLQQNALFQQNAELQRNIGIAHHNSNLLRDQNRQLHADTHFLQQDLYNRIHATNDLQRQNEGLKKEIESLKKEIESLKKTDIAIQPNESFLSRMDEIDGISRHNQDMGREIQKLKEEIQELNEGNLRLRELIAADGLIALSRAPTFNPPYRPNRP